MYALDRGQNFLNTDPPFMVPAASNVRIFRNARDLRFNRSFLITKSPEKVIRVAGKGNFPPFNKFNGLSFNIPVLRSADLLLMRSESNAVLGRIKESLFDLLYVKYRSEAIFSPVDDISNYYPKIETDPNFGAFLIAEVIRERRREFFGEGDRLHTLRRNRLDIPSSDRGTGLPWNSPSLVFPIPDTETSLNSKIK
jgi:hypothetical protein